MRRWIKTPFPIMISFAGVFSSYLVGAMLASILFSLSLICAIFAGSSFFNEETE